MVEKQLIRQLKQLRDIEPSENWVIFTKNRIFAGEPEASQKFSLSLFSPFFRYKLAFAPIVSMFVIIGLFGFAQNTLPGDFLFSVKKMTETAQVAFSSTAEKPTTHLRLANKRLKELSMIVENNQVRNMDSAIKEFQANIAQAAENLIWMGSVNVAGSNPPAFKELVAETQKLEENKEKIEAVLGTIIGDTEELEGAILQLEKQTAAYLISDLSQRTLSEEDEQLFSEAEQDFENGQYASSLEKIWLLSNK